MYECNICGEKFIEKYALTSHKAKIHFIKYHKCSHCDYVSEKKSDINKHFKKHSHQEQCSICKRKFKNDVELNLHIQEDHIPIHCDICNFTTTSGKESLRRHKRIKHGETQQKRVSSDSDNPHQTKRLKTENLPPSDDEPRPGPSSVPDPPPQKSRKRDNVQYHKCPNCDYVSDRSNNVKQHLKTHTHQYQCVKCKRKFRDISELNSHICNNNHNNEAKKLSTDTGDVQPKKRLKKENEPDNLSHSEEEPVPGPSHRPDPIPPPPPPPTQRNHVQGRFSNLIHHYKWHPRGKQDLEALFQRYKKIMEAHIANKHRQFDLMKYYICFSIEFYKIQNTTNERIQIIRHFNGGIRLHPFTSFDESYRESCNQIARKMDEFVHLGKL